MTAKTYGQEVYDLAWSFCNDSHVFEGLSFEQEAHELALEIQETIEDFFFAQEKLAIAPILVEDENITFGPPEDAK